MKQKEFSIIPFNSSIIKDKYLVSNVLGKWDFLDKEEFNLLSSLQITKGTPLFIRLQEKGLLLDSSNIIKLIDDYRNLNANLFKDTALHIGVVTTRCNLNCYYCQTNSPDPQDMDYNVARRILDYIFTVKSQHINLEFQGGEPLLNWPVLSFIIENARKFSAHRDLNISLVTNATLLDEDKMKFLVENHVDICVSLDGPKSIHDKNRIYKDGTGTYNKAMENIKKLKNKFNKKVDLLLTITRSSFGHSKEIINEYIGLGQECISLRAVNKLGRACNNWLKLGYSPEEFNGFYKNTMDYILELNKKGIFIAERMARVMSQKIFFSQDPGYVDLMNPCGAGRATMVYMPDGSCYPCDEARMGGEDMFKLGNILNEEYEDIVKKDTLRHFLQVSLVNLWNYNCVFSPWSGTCPVVNYYLQKNMVPKICCSPINKVMNYQFRYIFEKILEDKESIEIFKSWVRRKNEKK